MRARTRELLEYLDQTRRDLHEAAHAVPEAIRTGRPAADRWSAADVIEHLSRVGTSLGAVIAKHITEAPAAGTDADDAASLVVDPALVARLTNRGVRIEAPERARPAGLAWNDAWATLDRSRASLRETVIGADGLLLGRVVVPHPTIGSLDLYQWIVFIGAHEARHTAQIREIAGHVEAARG